ncbi:hypothetical protein AA21291_2487 [Swaminathania salitolerans LMG 21291]|uniref:Uncharacterized protein n=1 Tax=Swaminathania salitolerans TaxID=182838 RepID=A0A511BMW3_9PROT|nr:hypothetical protein AA21291_2487 [Swaminathania salitolerans LMG 21291]GEL01676.1 hypothetical protein SSA02_08390 [Swaminathania salitolerans]
MARFTAERLEIRNAGPVGRENAQPRARGKAAQAAMRAQHGEGTCESPDVEQGFWRRGSHRSIMRPLRPAFQVLPQFRRNVFTRTAFVRNMRTLRKSNISKARDG